MINFFVIYVGINNGYFAYLLLWKVIKIPVSFQTHSIRVGGAHAKVDSRRYPLGSRQQLRSDHNEAGAEEGRGRIPEIRDKTRANTGHPGVLPTAEGGVPDVFRSVPWPRHPPEGGKASQLENAAGNADTFRGQGISAATRGHPQRQANRCLRGSSPSRCPTSTTTVRVIRKIPHLPPYGGVERYLTLSLHLFATDVLGFTACEEGKVRQLGPPAIT